MAILRLHAGKAVQIAARIGLLRGKAYALLAAYYAATLFAATLDGVGVVVLVSLFTGSFAGAHADPVTAWTMRTLAAGGFEPAAGALLAVAAALIAIKVAVNVAIDIADAAIAAHLRRRMQSEGFASVLASSWERLRERRTGRMIATLVEEVQMVTKYLTVAVRGGYFVLSAAVFGLLSVAVSPELALLLAAVCIPVFVALRSLFGAQSRFSTEQTQARQAFAADLAERLGNLFQIKVEGGEAAHLKKGLRRTKDIARLEVLIGAGLAFIANASNLVLLVALGVFYFWASWRGVPLAEAFALLAGVGVVGSKAASHLNNAVSTAGNLARLSGSILPVHELLGLEPEPARLPIPGRLAAVELRDASYRYSDSAGLTGVTLRIDAGRPLLIRGPSGSGKTTLANLIAGVYLPSGGSVRYVVEGGSEFDSRSHRARVGYVPQDVAIFHGTVRDNLQPAGAPLSDEALWRILEQVGAADFVRRTGGLDATRLEGGRSLSGGERRRLGIARVLALQPNILILDEIMNGLDAERKAEISAVVEQLSRTLVTVAITHDPAEFPGWAEWRSGGAV